MQSKQSLLKDKDNLKTKNIMGKVLAFFVVFYIGFRPISFVFADMAVYAIEYEKYALGAELNTTKDIFFEMFMKYCSKIMSVEFFFLLCAALYTIPLYIASRKIFKDYWFYAFLMLVVSFSFWAYGTNGIRNGIATSFFIYALSCEKKIISYGIILLSIMIHKSMLLPALAYTMTFFYLNTRNYIIFWAMTIPLSLALGGFWEGFFMGLGVVEEDRLAGYLSENQSALDQIVEVKVGFRWDFILYSFSGVFAGWYFIIKKQFNDIFYNKLYSTYLIVNGFWILIIRANFSNRFAYLSWFILGLVIVYPYLKSLFFDRQHQILGRIIMLYFMFTYILNAFLGK